MAGMHLGTNTIQPVLQCYGGVLESEVYSGRSHSQVQGWEEACGGQLKSRFQEVRVIESKFADYVAVYAATREMLEEVVGEFVRTAADWGLTDSLEKTKLPTMGKRLKPEDNLPVQLNGGEIATVEDFTCLGSNIARDGEVHGEVAVRLGKASRAFACLGSSIFCSKQLSVAIKREVYCAVVLSTLMYWEETWTVKVDSVRRMRGFHNRCINAESVQAVAMEGENNIKSWLKP